MNNKTYELHIKEWWGEYRGISFMIRVNPEKYNGEGVFSEEDNGGLWCHYIWIPQSRISEELKYYGDIVLGKEYMLNRKGTTCLATDHVHLWDIGNKYYYDDIYKIVTGKIDEIIDNKLFNLNNIKQ